MANYESSLANNATFSDFRNHEDRLKTRYLWKGIVSLFTPRLTDDLYLHNQILLEVFSSIPKMTQKIFLLSYQTSPLKFFELRASILRFNGFIGRNLRFSFVGMRLDEDLCFTKLHRFSKQFLKPQLWLNVGVRVCWQFSLLKKSDKNGDN